MRLMEACEEESVEEVKKQVKKNPHCVNVKEGENSPLLLACEKGNEEIVKVLLENGPDISFKNQFGDAALHNACYFGYKNIVSMLLAAKADPNIRGAGGQTPLHRAAHTGREEIVALLVENNADIHIKDDEGTDVFNYACRYKSLPVVNVLLEKSNPNVNSKTNIGWGPLLSAVSSQSDLELVKIIVDAGADINAKNNKGENGLHWARIRQNEELENFFLTHPNFEMEEEKNIPIKGSNIVLAGTFKTNKQQLKQKIEALGGKTRGKVSPTTNICVLGKGSGSQKSRATNANAQLWDEEKLLKKLEEEGGGKGGKGEKGEKGEKGGKKRKAVGQMGGEKKKAKLEEEEEEGEEWSEADLKKMKVADLKTICEQKKLSSKGTKAILIQNILESQNEENESDYSEEDLQKMKVVDLKTICSEKGLKITGTKPVLIQRILEG